jgi:cephalosporin hydroxylase
MDNLKLWLKFYNYLDKSDNTWKNKPTSQIGLVKNAPKEAVKAYEKYKKQENESDLDRE